MRNTPTHTIGPVAAINVDAPIRPTHQNIVDTAAAIGSFKIFGKALQKAGMVDTLRGAGPFTLFAPTDLAFGKLPAGTLDALLLPENKNQLVSMLGYHLVAGRSSAKDVAKMKAVTMVNGQQASVAVSGKTLSLDGAQVTTPDIESCNGVLHGIDKVNIPGKR